VTRRVKTSTRRGSNGSQCKSYRAPAPGKFYTVRSVHSAPATASPLSERKRKFVDAFMASSNATQAAIVAGYSTKTAKQQGSRLLTNVDVQQAIAQRAAHDPAVWTRIQRQQFWTDVAAGQGRYAKTPIQHRLKASELLGKSQADFVERHELTAGNGGPIVFQVVTNVPQPEGRHGAD